MRLSELFSLVVLGLISSIALAAQGILPGSGTQTDPFVIEDFADFQAFCGSNSYWANEIYTRLDTDLDLTAAGIYPKAPIGPNNNDRYNGHFNGNGHIIRNLTVEGESNLGLFGYLHSSAVITNLGIENVRIKGVDCVGGLCGKKYGTITQCYVTGSVTGNYYFVGGLCGINSGPITQCYTTSSVKGRSYIGGLCGENDGGTISLCYATGNITGGEKYAGGLCGWHYEGTITQCYATGSVTGHDFVGGLCGENYGTISQCYANGSVTGDEWGIGGLCGENSGTISQCYSTGPVAGEVGVGGLCWQYIGTIVNSFWNVGTSGIGRPGENYFGAIGKTTAQMQDINTFLNVGWDFNAETANGPEETWHMPFNIMGYPMLWWQKDIPGDIAGSYGVDFEDVAALSSQWLRASAESSADLFEPLDGMVSIDDLQIIIDYWLSGR